jgi:cytidine deaminase
MKTLEIAAKIHILDESELTFEQKNVVEAAKSATSRSYSPYSHYKVGAACLLDNGEIITGSNQENAAYPSGLCAERTAVFYAQSRYPDARILKLCIVGKTASDVFSREVCAPCGACRQVILEAEYRSGAPIEILLPSQEGIYVLNGISTLLPFGFTYKEVKET